MRKYAIGTIVMGICASALVYIVLRGRPRIISGDVSGASSEPSSIPVRGRTSGARNSLDDAAAVREIESPDVLPNNNTSLIRMRYPYVGIRCIREKSTLLGPDGVITSFVASEVGLTDDEVARAQVSIRAFMEGMEKLIIEHATADSLRIDRQRGVHAAYVIKPFEELAIEVFDKLVTDLTQCVGKERQVGLLERYDIGLSYSGMGKYETTVQVRDYDSSNLPPGVLVAEKLRYRIAFQAVDPATGSVHGRGETSLDGFNSIFGNVLTDGDLPNIGSGGATKPGS